MTLFWYSKPLHHPFTEKKEVAADLCHPDSVQFAKLKNFSLRIAKKKLALKNDPKGLDHKLFRISLPHNSNKHA